MRNEGYRNNERSNKHEKKKIEGQSFKFQTFEMELKNWQQHIL